MSPEDNIVAFIIGLLSEGKLSEDEVKTKVEDFISKNKIGIKENTSEIANWRVKRFASQEDYDRYQKTGAIPIYTKKECAELFAVPQTHSEINIELEPGKGNLLLNEGITEIWNLVCLATGTKFDNANARLAVGDSSTAEVATQTGLQAATNKLYKAMDATYPQVSAQTATWKATFASAEANFAWNEFTVANGADDTSKNMNRKVSAQGTKLAGQVWELTLTITLS